MRFVATQLLTWGPIAGAIGSALLLAGLEGPADNRLAASPLSVALPLPGDSFEPNDVLLGGQPAHAMPAAVPPSAPPGSKGPGLPQR